MEAEDQTERFGTIALTKGYITWPQLLKALEVQIEENISKGEYRSIGPILCDLTFMTKLESKDVLESMENTTKSG